MPRETWFTSDHHFGHKNILVYEKEFRPFESVEEMNEELVRRWNSVVGHNDVVYHLGDFCFGMANLPLAARLNGRKRLILGNHDAYRGHEYLRYFERLYGVKYWENAVLSHIPLHPASLASRWLLNVHGHLHSNIMTDSNNQPDLNYFNVAVEQHNLTPVNADAIRERIELIRGNRDVSIQDEFNEREGRKTRRQSSKINCT